MIFTFSALRYTDVMFSCENLIACGHCTKSISRYVAKIFSFLSNGLGVSQASLSMPEILWKAYIDFEVDEQGDREKTRTLYERLVVLSGHHKVWISYAEFEGSSIPLPRAMREEEEDEDSEPRVVAGDPQLARQVFERGYKDLKVKGLKAEVRPAAL
jgi:hypothetical protein